MKFKTMFALAIGVSAISTNWAMTVSAQPPTGAAKTGLELTVEVTDIKHRDGQLIIAVYDRKEAFPNKFKKAVSLVKTSPNKPKVTINKLKPGNYAVVVIHDRNKNNEIDKSFVRMPKEPIGVSNFKTIGMTNPPNCQKALFSLKKSSRLKVKLISL